VLLIGLGPRSRLRPQAIPQGAAIERAGLLKTGAPMRSCTLALEEVPDLETAYRARAVAEVFSAANLQDSRSEERRPSPNRPSSRASRGGGQCALGEGHDRGPKIGAAIGAGSRSRAIWPTCPPTSARRPISASARCKLAKEWPRIKTKVLDEAAIKGAEDGRLPRGHARLAQPPRLIVCEYRGGKKDSAPICLIGKGITFDSGGIS
jgi:leucyl aminopeptidase